jgi:hypothetical protein
MKFEATFTVALLSTIYPEDPGLDQNIPNEPEAYLKKFCFWADRMRTAIKHATTEFEDGSSEDVAVGGVRMQVRRVKNGVIALWATGVGPLSLLGTDAAHDRQVDYLHRIDVSPWASNGRKMVFLNSGELVYLGQFEENTLKHHAFLRIREVHEE